MPLAKHRPDFAELITIGAVQRKRVSTRQKIHYSNKRKRASSSSILSASPSNIGQPTHLPTINDKEGDEQPVDREEDDAELSNRSSSERYDPIDGLAHIISQDGLVVVSDLAHWFLDFWLVRAVNVIITVVAFLSLTYEASNGINKEYTKASNMSDVIVSIYFVVEGFLKLLAFYTHVDMQKSFNMRIDAVIYFRKSGVVDIILGVFSLYFGSHRIGGWFRLVRVMLISSFALEEIPHFVILVSGITHGLKSILSTCLLLFLVFMVYGACALFFFKDNDPYHFGTIALAMWTFFELATLDNWSQVLYVNMYGCDRFPAYYTVVNSTYTGVLSISRLGSTLKLPICSEPSAHPEVSVILFLSFIVISAFILVNLTIAAVTSGINVRLDKIKDEGSNMSVMGALVKAETMLDVNNAKPQLIADPDMLLIMLTQVWKEQDEHSRRRKLERKDRQPSLSSKRILPVDHSILDLSSYSRSTLQQHNSDEEGDDGDYQLFNKDFFDLRTHSIVSRDILGNQFYQYGVIGIIILSALLELITLQSQSRHVSLLVVNLLLQFMFSIDLYIQIVAMYPNTKAFFRSKWNTFDAAIVLFTWVPVLSWGRGSGILGLLNVLRILRLLKLLRWIHELNVILHSIASSALAIFYVYILIMVMIYHFAVAGVFLFDKNDPQHFGSLVSSFVTLFQIMSLDDWSEIARTNMYGCDYWGYDTGEEYYDEQCVSPHGLGWWAALYFLIYVILSVMVLLSLFVGIIITSMELLKEGIKEENEVWEKVKIQQHKYKMRDATINNLLEIFDLIDIGMNGKLTLNELKPIFDIIKISEASQFSLFMKIDDDDSGQIDFAEFIELLYLVGKAYKAQCKKSRAKLQSNMSKVRSVARAILPSSSFKENVYAVDNDTGEKDNDHSTEHHRLTNPKVFPTALSVVKDGDEGENENESQKLVEGDTSSTKKLQSVSSPPITPLNKVLEGESVDNIKMLKEVASEFSMSFFLKQMKDDRGSESKDDLSVNVDSHQNGHQSKRSASSDNTFDHIEEDVFIVGDIQKALELEETKE